MEVAKIGRDIIPFGNDGIVRGAMRAYERWTRDFQVQPSRTESDLLSIHGKHYAVLRNVNGVLAVYRYFRNQDRLRFVDPDFEPMLYEKFSQC